MDRECFLIKINSMMNNIDEITVQFYQGHYQTAYQNVFLILDEITIFISQIEQSMASEIEMFNQILIQMIRALENKDEILLADILRYEFKEKLKQFEQMI